MRAEYREGELQRAMGMYDGVRSQKPSLTTP